ncbi:MAG TPA: DNA repair protein RecO [Prolixibacteraceae bacterium]|nr:DNA repair protein RecO [Prolixibacteraceae bacterium]
MITSTKAIVLHQVKYAETSIIVTLYTEAFGRQSYIVNGIRSAKSKQKMGLLQPLFQLEIEAYHKPGRGVQRIKEFRADYVYQSVPFDVTKRSVSFFLAEVMFKVLRSEESDSEAFIFIQDSLQFFDQMAHGAANFHLWFIVNLLKYLGLQPNNNFNENYRWFDMKNGRFLLTRPLLPQTPDAESSWLLSVLFSHSLETLHQLELNGKQRTRLLELLLEYYAIHLEHIGKINSLDILKELFY